MALSGSYNQYSANNPKPLSKLVSPQGFVLINGISVPWQSFEVSKTRYSAAGTFHIKLPVSALPKSISLPLMMNVSPLNVQINAGVPSQINTNNATPSDVPLLIQGNADEVKYEPAQTMLTISGRDYIGLFADNKIGQTTVTPAQQPINLQSILALNYSSAIVSQLAKSRGLIPVVTSTTNPVGKYFQSQFALLSSQITEWDLMTFLAKQEGFDIYVLGKNLYFQPKAANTPYQITIAVPYYTTNASLPVTNVEEITFTRNYRLAKNIIVNVSSWNLKDKMTYKATATLVHTATAPSDSQIYNYTLPNLTQAQVTLKAQNLLQQISQHEMRVNIKMPGDSLVTPHSLIAVKDTGTIFDQTYYVKNVTFEMAGGSSGGYHMYIEAKTQTPYSTSVTT